jgi:signal transduction histidine kinase/CheY-like chemotaxis protein
MYFNEACINYPAALLITDPKSGKIISANNKAASIYGYSKEELLNMNINDIYVLEVNRFDKEPFNFSSEKNNYSHTPHKTASNKIITVLEKKYPTKINGNTYILSKIFPSEEKVSFNGQKFNSLYDSNSASMVVDNLNRVIKINEKFEALFNCKQLDSIGKFGYTLIKGLDKNRFDSLLKNLSTSKTNTLTFYNLDDNNTYNLTAYASTYLDDYMGAYITINQIFPTSNNEKFELDLEHKLEEIEEKSSKKDDFLARMSHDMRTPMNAILGMANFGIEEIKDPKAVQYFSQIKDSSEYLLALINDILDMQRLERGEIQLQEVITFTPRIAQKIINIIKPRAQQKDIKLTIDLECESLLKYVKVDERRIEQILINILNNAIKYTPVGGHVTWKDYVTDIGNGKVKISHEISDTGVGMSEEFQKVMFEPFTSEVNSQSRHEGGSGLGLAITKNLIDIMGGKLSCKSKLGVGTTFYIDIILNLATEEDIENFIETSSIKINEGSLKNKKILICEDIDVNITILKKLLATYNCNTEVAKNGVEGVKLAKENKYDAILMDIRMPLLDGLTATKEIRKFNKDIPIVALSANAFSQDIEKSLSAGMNAHLSKPIIKEELYSVLSSLIQ